MQESPEIEATIDLVNSAVPEHARGVIDPQSMLEQRASNCFGKVALVGVALIEQGLSEASMSLLLCHNHGMKFKVNRHWLGHAQLAIDSPYDVLIDGDKHIFQRDLRTSTSWTAGHGPGDAVIDFEKLPRQIKKSTDWEELDGLDQLTGPPQIYKVQHRFSVHSLSDGLAVYQATHPLYEDKDQIQLSDYQACYHTLAG